MIRNLAALAAMLVAFVAPVQAQSADASRTLHQLFDEEWERGLRENPVGASYQGDPRYNDRWADVSPAAIEASAAADRAALARIRAIDRNALSPADQLNYDTFLWLQEKGVTQVDVCGIATDYCVRATALDANNAGFGTTVLARLTAGVAPASTEQAITDLRTAGVTVTT